MSYHFSKTVAGDMDGIVARTTEVLKEKGFGVLTTIDVGATLKAKLDVDFGPYVILGACNPKFAHRALTAENKIGVMLPCNVVVQQVGPYQIEVSAVDPIASMQAIDSPDLGEIATEVQGLLKAAIEAV